MKTNNNLHSHSDKLIKTCPVCQKNIREINESGKRLAKLGVFTIPKDIKKRLKRGEEVEIWTAK